MKSAFGAAEPEKFSILNVTHSDLVRTLALARGQERKEPKVIESPLQIDKFAYFFEGQSYRLNRVPVKPKQEPAFHPEQSRTLDNDLWCKYDPSENSKNARRAMDAREGRAGRGEESGPSREKRLMRQFTAKGADGQRGMSQSGSRGHRLSPGKRMPRSAYGSPDATMKGHGGKKHSAGDTRSSKLGAR